MAGVFGCDASGEALRGALSMNGAASSERGIAETLTPIWSRRR